MANGDMKIRIVYDSSVPSMFTNADGITLYPFIFLAFNAQDPRTPKLLKHELVHVAQIRNLGFFKFYTTYVFYYLKNLIKYKDAKKAYLNNPYEIEAYIKQEEQ